MAPMPCLPAEIPFFLLAFINAVPKNSYAIVAKSLVSLALTVPVTLLLPVFA